MAEQLTLDLPVRPSRGREDFFVSSANALALTRLESLETWPNGKLVLTGPEGAGKSHLASVWAESNAGRVIDADQLPHVDIGAVETAIAVDHIDTEPLADAAETALFHLHNHLAQQSLPLLMVGRAAPTRWPIRLPDLKSRASGSDMVAIDQPDDALLTAMYLKLFADRQVQVAPNVVPWLVSRSERSFAAVQTLVTALDTAALVEKRPITQPLARRVLDNLPNGSA